MRARLTSPCICGSIVRPGMEIAFDHVMRLVVMCPKCSPSAGKRKYRTSGGVVVTYRGSGYRVQSLRDRSTGELAGFVVRWAAADSCQSWVRFIWRGGEFVKGFGGGFEAPTHLTVDDMHALVALAKDAAKAQKAAA